MAKRRNKNKAKRGLKGRASNTRIQGISKDAKLCADDIGADGCEMAPATENGGDGVLVTETENTCSGATETHKTASKPNNMKRKKKYKHKKVLSDKTGLNAVVNTINSEKEQMTSDDNLIFPKEVDGDVCIDVECGSNEAVMFLSKLYLGSKGACIEHKGSWLTPNEFQLISGRETAKDWKRSIRHNGKSLKLLITKGLITINTTCPEQSKDASSESVEDRLEQECSSPKLPDQETVINVNDQAELEGDLNTEDDDNVISSEEAETMASTDAEQTTSTEATNVVFSGSPVAVESSVPNEISTDVVKKKKRGGRRGKKKQKKKLKGVMTYTEAENTPTVAVRVKDGKVQGVKVNIGSTGEQSRRPAPSRKKGSKPTSALSRNTGGSTETHIPFTNSADQNSNHNCHGDEDIERNADRDGDHNRDRTDDQHDDVPAITDTRTNEERELDEFVKSLRLTKKTTSPVLAAKAAPTLKAVHPPLPTPKISEADNDDVEMPVLQKEPCIVTPRCPGDNAERVIPCEIDTFHSTVTPPPTPPGELPEVQKSAQHDHTKETYKARLSPLNDGLKLTINREKVAMKFEMDSKPVVKQQNLQSLLLQDALQSAKKYKETLHKNKHLSPIKPIISVPKLKQSPKAETVGKLTTELDTNPALINSEQPIKATDDVKHEQSAFTNYPLDHFKKDRLTEVNIAKSSHTVCSNNIHQPEMYNKQTAASISTPKLELFNSQPICTPSVSRSETVNRISKCSSSLYRTDVLNKAAVCTNGTPRSEALNKQNVCTSYAQRSELSSKPTIGATSTSRADMLNTTRANDVMAMMQATYGTSPFPLNTNEAMMASFQNLHPEDMQSMLNMTSTNTATSSSSPLLHPMITQQFLLAMTQQFYNMCNTSAKTQMKHDMKTNQKLSENHKTSVNKKPKDISNKKRKYSEVDANGALDLSMKKTKLVSSNSPVCASNANDDIPLDFSKKVNLESRYSYANPMLSTSKHSFSSANQLYYAGQAAPDISNHYKYASRHNTVSASSYRNTRPNIPDSKQLKTESVTSKGLECHSEDKLKFAVGRYAQLPDRRHSGSKVAKETCKCASRDDISKWNVEQVCSFLITLEGCAAYARTFYDQGISGRLLPYLTTQHLTRTLGMKVGPALILMQAVERKFREAMMVPACKLCKTSAAIPVQQM